MDLPKTVMVAKLVDAVSSKILICITYYNATNHIIENRREKHKTYPKEQNVNCLLFKEPTFKIDRDQ